MKYLAIILAMLTALAATAIVSAQKSGSCSDSGGATFCNSVSKDGCYCDPQCTKLGDCCKDYTSVCAETPVCGDGVCASQESCGSSCAPGEPCTKVCVVTCPQDCTKSVCGDGLCTPDEDQIVVCPQCIQTPIPTPCDCVKNCPVDCAKISETVTCQFVREPIFSDSTTKKAITPLTKKAVAIPSTLTALDFCSASTGVECSGSGSCSAKVTGAKGTSVTWKSSCGNYQYSTIDGKDETVYFYCQEQAQITKSDVLNWIQSHCDEPYYALAK